ncbi:MAG: hypothetical protein H6720_27595 [Sandaracinus sp.]|nr:hypothetical protein [Sandaracinus sp.]
MQRDALKVGVFRGPQVLVLFMYLGSVGTWLTNGEPIRHGPVTLPGITAYDTFANVLDKTTMWVPAFYLGYALFRDSRDLYALMKFIVQCALVYTLFIMFELRMSPQLHNWIYGYHPSDFVQTIRFGGYRPMCFMRHGLNLALFMTVATFCSIAIMKAKLTISSFWTPPRTFALLLVTLIFCKSTGAYFHLLIGLPLLLFTKPRTQGRVTAVIVGVILTYPMLRLADLVPVDGIHDFMAENVNEERALSLWFRLFTEGQILENTRDRLFFGWGGYGRAMEYDEATGEMLSVLDGYWTIELGANGLAGWACVFGMMLWPVISALRALKRITDPQIQRLVATAAFIIALYVSDWLPNSSLAMEFTLFAGALGGCIPGILAEEAARRRVGGGTAAPPPVPT